GGRTKGRKGGKGKDKESKHRANKAEDEVTLDESSDSDASVPANIATISKKSYRNIHAYLSSEHAHYAHLHGTIPRILDSGASKTMTPERECFDTSSYRPLVPPKRIRLGNDVHVDAIGIGTMRLPCKTRNGLMDTTIRNTLHVPDF
ncbi:hypothetical protein C8Q78DRAFT_941075, partial [Trametes maxima]